MMRALFGGTDEPDEPEPQRFAETERGTADDGHRFDARSPSPSPSPPPPAATTTAAVPDAVPSFIVGDRFFDFVQKVDVVRSPNDPVRLPRGVKPRLAASDGTRFALASVQNVVCLSFGAWRRAPLHFNHVPACIACGAETLAVGFVSGSVYYRGAGIEKQMSDLSSSGSVPVGLRLESNGRLWVAFRDKVVLAEPALDEPLIRTIRASNVCALDVSEELLAVVTGGGECCLYDKMTGAERGSFRIFFGAGLCVAFSSDGKLVALGGEDDIVTVYSTAAGGVVLRCLGSPSFVTGVAFGPSESSGAYNLACVCDSRLLFFQLTVGADAVAAPGTKKADVPTVESTGYAGGFPSRLTDVLWKEQFLVLAFGSGGACIYTTAKP